MALPPQQVLANVAQRFNELPNNKKIALVVSLAATIAMFVGLMVWSQAPEYKVLFSGLSERDGGAVVATLQQQKVPYKVVDGGTAIMVPSEQVYDLRFKLAAQGLPKGGTVGFELMDGAKLGMTQFQEQVTYQRALEGELARSIQSLAPVESARVHLAMPKPSVFVREKQAPSASVLVNLFQGRVLDFGQVGAVVHLISSSVPGLAPSNVTVVDQNGNLLTDAPDAKKRKGMNVEQHDYLREIEDYYAKRVEAIVEPIVGKDNVKAEVRADLDFSETEYTSEVYKPNPTPEQQSVRSRQSLDESNTNGQPAGVPGAFSNQPPGPATAPMQAPAGANAGPVNAQGQAAGSRRRDETINYELDKTIRHVREPLGRVKRLSVAVVVNYRQAAAGQSPKPLTPQELQQVSNLVREAMGYNQARGDTVNVVNAAFTEAKPEEGTPLWKDPENIALAKELMKNLLLFGLAFYVVFGVVRPLLRDLMKPPEPEAAPVAEGEGGISEAEIQNMAKASYESRLEEVRAIARDNPKVAADILKEWITKE